MEVIGLSRKVCGCSETAVRSLDFPERFVGVVKRLSDLGVDGWASVARCNKIQVEAEKKSK